VTGGALSKSTLARPEIPLDEKTVIGTYLDFSQSGGGGTQMRSFSTLILIAVVVATSWRGRQWRPSVASFAQQAWNRSQGWRK
jgi:hypothetical protein